MGAETTRAPRRTPAQHSRSSALLSADELRERVSAALRRRREAARPNVKRWDDEHADRLRVHEDTLARWRYAETAPHGHDLINLCLVFGTSFLAEVLPELLALAGTPADDAATLRRVADALDGRPRRARR